MYYSIIKQVAHCDRNDGSWQNGIAAHLRRTGGSFGRRLFKNHLYLIDAGFKEEHLNALMKRIIEDPEFNIKYIVLFGYNFNDWSINEMMEKNTKVIKNSNKALNIDILTRF